MLEIWIMAAHPARRDWLLRSLKPEPSIRIAALAPTFSFLKSLMSETSADLAVVDTLSQKDPVVVREWVQELLDRAPLLLLSSELDPSIVQRMVRSGSGGVLEAEASPERIIQAIRSVASGLIVLDGAFGPQPPEDESAADLLTARETEVLRLLAEGSGNKEIAAQLNISEHTIKFHIHSILGKLGASSRTEAVSRGLRSGLIEF